MNGVLPFLATNWPALVVGVVVVLVVILAVRATQSSNAKKKELRIIGK